MPKSTPSAHPVVSPDPLSSAAPPEPRAVKPVATTFVELGLSPAILACVEAAGYKHPTPIQARFIPHALAGKDVMGQAKTGTGKTAAFVLPLFARLRPGAKDPAALILAPTRELALQIHGEVERLGQGLGFSSVTLYGGSSYEPQIAALARGVDLVVGTPGRVMDHLRARRLRLESIQAAVLDEADRMLDLGFRKDIEYILRHCPSRRQTLLLSATLAGDILKLARRFMHEPVEVWTAPESLTVDQVEQCYAVVERENKFPFLLKILDVERPGLAIVFCTTKIGAKRLAAKLLRLHLNAREIHGDLVQAKREKIMGHFRKGKVQILVATDVASRGIDVQDITHIINYDVPYRTEDYVHRIGRTGRMDKGGKAITLLTKEEGPVLTEIEVLINKELKVLQFENLESRFWPNPPTEIPADFLGEDLETAMSASDYLTPGEKGGPKGRHGRSGSRHSRSGAPASSGGAHAARTESSLPSGAGSGASAERGHRPRRGRRGQGEAGTSTEIVCSACGAKTSVPFLPDPKRPVYCDKCYAAKKGERRGGGA